MWSGFGMPFSSLSLCQIFTLIRCGCCFFFFFLTFRRPQEGSRESHTMVWFPTPSCAPAVANEVLISPPKDYAVLEFQLFALAIFSDVMIALLSYLRNKLLFNLWNPNFDVAILYSFPWVLLLNFHAVNYFIVIFITLHKLFINLLSSTRLWIFWG